MSQPAPGDVHVDGYGEPPKKKGKKKKLAKRLAKALGVKRSDVEAALRKEQPVQKSEIDVIVPIWKDDTQNVIYGIVLTPDVYDSQGDKVSADEIEKAAHRYLTDFRRTDIQHAEQQAQVEVIESYIAPQDLTIAGKPVAKGAWVMAHRVNDPEVWQQVLKGELTGLSMGGSAIRIAEGES